MSLETILGAIEAEGAAETARMRQAAEARVQQALQAAEAAAAARREAARRAPLRAAAGERARRLQRAKLEALRLRGEVRDRLIDAALAEARRRVSALRDDPAYPRVLRRLAGEAVEALGDEVRLAPQPRLEVDLRDEALARQILADLGLELPLAPALDCWGGLVARSGDGRIVVINTLEARFERALPFLRQDLGALVEQAAEAPPQAVPVS
jgi:V/A-type H+-transporting ATPase subunit E